MCRAFSTPCRGAKNKADNALKTARDTKDALSDYAKKSDVSASVDTYINSDEGKASIVASLSGTYVTSDDLTGYVEKTELSAEVGAYIDTAAGTAKIVGNLTGTFVKEDALGNYVQKRSCRRRSGRILTRRRARRKSSTICPERIRRSPTWAAMLRPPR